MQSCFCSMRLFWSMVATRPADTTEWANGKSDRHWLRVILANRPKNFLANLVLDASKHFFAMDANFLRRTDAQLHYPSTDVHNR